MDYGRFLTEQNASYHSFQDTSYLSTPSFGRPSDVVAGRCTPNVLGLLLKLIHSFTNDDQADPRATIVFRQHLYDFSVRILDR
jgi:hypothetical protein